MLQIDFKNICMVFSISTGILWRWRVVEGCAMEYSSLLGCPSVERLCLLGVLLSNGFFLFNNVINDVKSYQNVQCCVGNILSEKVINNFVFFFIY